MRRLGVRRLTIDAFQMSDAFERESMTYYDILWETKVYIIHYHIVFTVRGSNNSCSRLCNCAWQPAHHPMLSSVSFLFNNTNHNKVVTNYLTSTYYIDISYARADQCWCSSPTVSLPTSRVTVAYAAWLGWCESTFGYKGRYSQAS